MFLMGKYFSTKHCAVEQLVTRWFAFTSTNEADMKRNGVYVLTLLEEEHWIFRDLNV
jgi:hypothetical protein